MCEANGVPTAKSTSSAAADATPQCGAQVEAGVGRDGGGVGVGQRCAAA